MNKIVLPQIVAIGIYNAQIAIKNRTISKWENNNTISQIIYYLYRLVKYDFCATCAVFACFTVNSMFSSLVQQD